MRDTILSSIIVGTVFIMGFCFSYSLLQMPKEFRGGVELKQQEVLVKVADIDSRYYEIESAYRSLSEKVDSDINRNGKEHINLKENIGYLTNEIEVIKMSLYGMKDEDY